MSKILLEVEVRGHAFVPNLTESNTVVIGQAYPSGQVTVTVRDAYAQRTWGTPDLYQFVVEWGAEVSLGVVARWLYEKARAHVHTVRINRREVATDEDEILRVLQEANALREPPEQTASG